MTEHRRDSEPTDGAVAEQSVEVGEHVDTAELKTEQEKDERKLRTWLKIYFSAPIRWKDSACSIQVMYLLIAVIQVVKVSLLTWQLFVHGGDRAMFNRVVHRGHLTLKHLLLENWDASWETVPYPPSHGDFAVYTIDSLESGINYSVSRYYNAEIDAIGFYKRIDTDSIKATMKYFDFPGFQAGVDKGITISEKKFAISHGLTNETKDEETKYSYSIAKELQYLNISQPMKRMLTTTLEFTIHSVRPHEETRRAICLRIKGKVIFSDTDDNGQVVVNLDTETSRISCGVMNLSIEDLNLENTSKPLGQAVFWFCICSAICTVLTVIFGVVNCVITKLHFKKYRKTVKKCQRFLWHMGWDILVLVSDVCTIYGTSRIVFDTPRSELELSLLDTHAILLGVGCLLAWFGILRYFRVHNKFHLLFRTVSRAIPDVIAYMFCVAVLFIGFWICGYLVLGPYHIKFQTPVAAALTLFAIAYGDEIYATLAMFDEDQTGSKIIWRFAHVYIGVYVTVYAIVVINLLIALLMSAYEEIKTKPKESSIDPMELAIEAFKNERNAKKQRSALYELLRSLNEKSDAEQTLETELGQIVKTRDVKTHRSRTLKTLFRDEETKTYCHCLCTPHFSKFCIKKEEK